MKKYTYCLCRAAALLLALTALLSCMSMSASALSFVSLPGANITDTTGTSLLSLLNTSAVNNNSASSIMEKKEAGIYWLGCFRDLYQALNLQYDRVTSGLVLDPMTFQGNELWILKPISSNSVYFTLEPLSHPGYYITGQRNDVQLRLSKTSASNYAVQWAAIPDGDRYILVNRQTGLAMDTAHGYSTTGNKVVNYTRNGYQDAQSWSMIRVSESTSVWYPGVKTTIANGTYGILSAGNTAKCVNDKYASTAGNGSAKICLHTWNYERHETYVFTNRGNGRYTISPAHATNLCLNVWAADPTAGNQLTLATYRAGDECSLWEIYRGNEGYYSFRNVKTGLWLNLWCNTHTDGQKIVGYYYDGTSAMKWKLQSVSSSSNAAAAAQSSSGYAAYTGVNYRNLTSDSRRIAACEEAVRMATVLWKNTCNFPTWKSKSGGYNTVTATDGTSSTKFLAGKTYQGIPYSMAGRTYDDSKWLSLVKNGLSAGTMTGKYYTSRADTTARGIDCSYLVCQALNTGCGTSVSLNTSGMLNSSKFRKISLSQMLPGDIFLKNGHVMFFMGKTASGRYAIIEANAAYSRVVYRELSSSGIGGYGCYRYTGFC